MKQFLLLLLSASLALGDTFTPVPTRIVGPGGSSVSVSNGDVSIQPQSGGAVNVVTGTMYVPTIIDFSTSVSPLVSGSGHFSLAFNGTSILSSTNGGAYAAFGGSAWGGITGTLSAQTDLQTALNAKQSTITFGTGIQTALGVNIGSAGAPVLFNGAGGTPSSLTLTNATGLPNASVTGLGALATVTPGAGVATAAAIAVNTAGGPLTHGGAGAHTTLTATSLNGNTFTTGTYTLTGTAGKTLTFSNTLTLAGTDSSTLNIGTGGTLGTAAFSASSSFAASGANSDITSLSGITAATGGASNMTITSGTGASRTLIFKTTTSGSTATTALTLDAVQGATVAGATAITGASTGAFQVPSGGIYAGNFVYSGTGLVAGLWNTSDAGGSLITAINGNNLPSLRIIRSGVGKTDFTWQGTGGTRRLDIIDTDNSVTPISLNMSGTGAVTFAGPVSGVTTLANTGTHTVTSGDVVCATAGKGLQLKSGTGARAGNAVLVSGTVTVTNTTVTANTVVYLTRKTSGGTIGTALTYTLSAGASFTITSDSAIDTSTISYLLVELN